MGRRKSPATFNVGVLEAWTARVNSLNGCRVEEYTLHASSISPCYAAAVAPPSGRFSSKAGAMVAIATTFISGSNSWKRSIIPKVDIHLVAPSYTGASTFLSFFALSYFNICRACELCLKCPTTVVILDLHLAMALTVLAFFIASATTCAEQGNLYQPSFCMALCMAGALSVVKYMGILSTSYYRFNTPAAGAGGPSSSGLLGRGSCQEGMIGRVCGCGEVDEGSALVRYGFWEIWMGMVCSSSSKG